MVGTLALSGLDPLSMLDRYSWDQIAVVVGAIDAALSDRADLLLLPLLRAQVKGTMKWKGYGDARRRKLAARRRAEAAAAAGASTTDDIAKKLAGLGFRVRDERGNKGG